MNQTDREELLAHSNLTPKNEHFTELRELFRWNEKPKSQTQLNS